ncbi:MAG: Maf family nucleotide pyrophosphatase [Hyphomonadaceae bacterium]
MSLLILASTSAARQRILRDAGLTFEAIAPALDEEAAKVRMREEGMALREQAAALAALKALSISETRKGLVIGADQMLALEEEVFDKPRDAAEARAHLVRLRGRTHELITALVAARDGVVIWRHTDAPRLKMRNFSDTFLDLYLRQAGDDVLRSVGGYQLEGLGAQLFERVEGDYFSVLGLPLLPLLAFLRAQGMAPE